MPFLAFFSHTVESYGTSKISVAGDKKNETAKG
jgi:hypothetical protein